MKKWIKYFGTGLLVLALTACGNDTDGQSKSEPKTSKTDDKETDELTATDLYKKTLAATSEQNSMHLTMDIEQTKSVPEKDFNSNTKTNIESSLVLEPFSVHQAVNSDIDNEEILLELYATDDVFYLYSEFEDIWVELPEEDKEEIVGDFTEDIDQFLFLKLFEEFANDFTVEETDNSYTIKLASSGNKFDDIIHTLIIDEMLAEFEEGEEVEIGILDISDMTLEFSIAKDTFYITGFTLSLDVSLEVDGVEIIINQQTKTIVDKLNEFEKVDIPQKVIDNAVKYGE